MSTTLTQVDTDEVSLVDMGAVQRKFAFLKRRKEGPMNEQIIKAVLQHELEPKAEKAFAAYLAKQQLDPAAKDALKGIMRLMSSFGDTLGTDHLQHLSQLAGFAGSNFGGAGDASAAQAETPAENDDTANSDIPDDDNTDDNADEDNTEDDDTDTAKGKTDDDTEQTPDAAAAAAATAAAAGAAGAAAAQDPKGKKKPAVAKRGATQVSNAKDQAATQTEALSPVIKAEMERLRKSADDTTKLLAVEIKKRERREALEKARAEFSHLGPIEKTADMITELVAKGAWASMEPTLRALNEQNKQSALFKQSASGAPKMEANSPEDQMHQVALEIQKADGNLTYEKAYDQAYTRRNDLVKAMHAERLQKHMGR